MLSYLSLAMTMLATGALGAPLGLYTRQVSAADMLVFQFADVLEQLESQFYQEALSKFVEQDFVAAGFSSAAIATEQFSVIQADEAAHSVALQAGLTSFGAQPVTSCKFDFSSVLTDVATMSATARLVENLGVSAYIGGASLLSDPRLLVSAGSILTVEARHQTVLNILSGTGVVVPQAFDVGFTPSEVLAIASGFISGCDLGIPANVALKVTNTDAVAPGTLLTFEAQTINGTIPNDSLFCQIMTGGMFQSLSLPLAECTLPTDASVSGPVAVWITGDSQPLLTNVVDRSQTKTIAGPVMFFVDSSTPQALPQLIVNGGAAGGGGGDSTGTASADTTTQTSTVTPEEATSILQSAQAEATAASNAGGGGSGGGGNASPTGTIGAITVLGPSVIPAPGA